MHAQASRAHPPHSCFQFRFSDGRLLPGDESAFTLDPFEPEISRRAVLGQEPILRPGSDARGRTIILVYAPGWRVAPGGANTMVSEVYVVSMLHFGDLLRQAARDLGMGNFTARIVKSLVENGSLRRASTSLGISHETARSEIADAMLAADVHSQCGLVRSVAETWLDEGLQSERAISLLRSTFGLSLRDATVASLRAGGMSRPQAARKLGLSQWSMEASCTNIFATVGVTKAPELTRVLADLMLSADLAEALSAARLTKIPA